MTKPKGVFKINKSKGNRFYRTIPFGPMTEKEFLVQTRPMPSTTTTTYKLPKPSGVELESVSSTSPGLQYLETVSQLVVHQEVEYMELLTGEETENRYTIQNSAGQDVFKVLERSGWLARRCFGSSRAFEMSIQDVHQNEIIHLSRPHVCCNCLCCPCLPRQRIKVYTPPGEFVGSVRENCSLICPSFSIKNESGKTEMNIKGPCCTYRICRDVKFHVYSKNGEDVGTISKIWSGMVRERYTSADSFSITFPVTMDVRMKAVMLGALFLIDYLFYENTPSVPRARTDR